MPLFRKRTLFHVEERLPDQEELKLRFRRRILAGALLGFLLVLGFPVFRELKPTLEARRETRWLAETLLDARLLAARSRAPVSLRLEGDRWKRTQLPAGANCTTKPAELGPEEVWEKPLVAWRMKLQRPSGEPVEGTELCVHPVAGLMLGEEAVAEGTLLVTASPKNADEGEPSRQAHLLISQYGAEVQTLSH